MGLCRVHYRLIVFLLFSVLLISGCSGEKETLSRCYSLAQFQKKSTPSFSTYCMNVRDGSRSRLDIYFLMQYNRLKFEKTSGVFKASYTVTVVLLDSTTAQIKTEERDRTVEVKTYEETISQSADFFMLSFAVLPGTYTIKSTSTDNLSQLHYQTIQKTEARDYSSPAVFASTPLFLDTSMTQSSGVVLRPIFPYMLTRERNSFGVFQELYQLQSGDTIKLSMSFYGAKKTEEQSPQNASFAPPYRVASSSCSMNTDSLLFTSDSIFIASQGESKHVIQFFPMPPKGFVTVQRTITAYRNGDSVVSTSTHDIFVQNSLIPNRLPLSEVVQVMQYVLRNDEFHSLDTLSDSEKLVWIKTFWKEHGGEIRQNEFQKRISEANSLFSSYCRGALTPMGITYIVCDQPEYIECRGSFGEIWYYNIGERAFSIEFRALHADRPNYFEIAPFSINENLWQYFVERWRKK